MQCQLQLALFLLTFVAIVGAWLGFWVVHKLVLTEDGSVDVSTAQFVAWAIRILAAIMILQVCLFIFFPNISIMLLMLKIST